MRSAADMLDLARGLVSRALFAGAGVLEMRGGSREEPGVFL